MNDIIYEQPLTLNFIILFFNWMFNLEQIEKFVWGGGGWSLSHYRVMKWKFKCNLNLTALDHQMGPCVNNLAPAIHDVPF